MPSNRYYVAPIHAVAFASLALGGIASGCGDSTGPVAGPAASVRLVSGGGQSATVGQELPSPIVLEVLSPTHRPVSGVAIFGYEDPNLVGTLGARAGTIIGDSAITDASGRASIRWRMAESPGSMMLQFVVTPGVVNNPPSGLGAAESRRAGNRVGWQVGPLHPGLYLAAFLVGWVSHRARYNLLTPRRVQQRSALERSRPCRHERLACGWRFNPAAVRSLNWRNDPYRTVRRHHGVGSRRRRGGSAQVPVASSMELRRPNQPWTYRGRQHQVRRVRAAGVRGGQRLLRQSWRKPAVVLYVGDRPASEW